jgi:hypothetical protein
VNICSMKALVLLADLGELLLAEVRLVRQADAALLDEDEIALGVAGVVVDEELHEAAHPLALEATEGRHEFLHGCHGVDLLEGGRQWCRAERLDPLEVHEAREEVADLALLGAWFGVLRLLDDGAHRPLRLLSEHVERAVACLVRWDLRAVDPPAVDVSVEVVLRADRRVEFVEGNAGFERHAPTLIGTPAWRAQTATA